MRTLVDPFEVMNTIPLAEPPRVDSELARFVAEDDPFPYAPPSKASDSSTRLRCWCSEE